MMKIAEIVSALLRKGEAALRSTVLSDGAAVMDSAAAHLIRKAAVIPGRNAEGEGILLVVADSSKDMPDHFQGETCKLPGGFVALWGKKDHVNALALSRHFPWCTPQMPPEKGILLEADSAECSCALFSAALQAGFFPVAPSWDDAVYTAFALDFRRPFGAKEAPVVLQAENDSSRPDGGEKQMMDEYEGKNFVLQEDMILSFFPGSAEKCVCRWKAPVESAKGGSSVTFAPLQNGEPLSCQEHLFLVRELRKRNLEFSGFAPRFSADPETFFRELPCHAAIARSYGNCRLHLPALFWNSPEKVRKSLPDGFAVSWSPALCPDLLRFHQKYRFNLGNSTK